MSNYILYFLKVNLGLIILFGIFSLINRRNNIPLISRFALLLIPLLSLLLPWISFNLPARSGLMENIPLLTDTTTGLSFSKGNESVNAEGTANNIHFISLLFMIWVSGVISGTILLLLSILKKLKLIYIYGIKTIDSLSVIPVDKNLQPFSFMRLIFIDLSRYDSQSLRSLLLHEKAHIIQYHFFDLIFMEVFRLVFWCNPVSWQIYRKLKESHEYLADSYVLNNGIDRLSYFRQIIKLQDPQGFSILESSFSGFRNIKRIKMMKTKHNTKSILGKTLLTLTLFGIIILAFGFINPKPDESTIIHIETENLRTKSILSEMTNPPSISPLDLNKVKFTSAFGMRMHPIKKIEMMHKGIDLAAPEGTDVFSTADGTILKVGYKPEGPGNFILIKHDGTYGSFYSQLEKVLVNEGDKVIKGEIIGKVGSSGVSTGPHLHYEVRKNGEAIDPSGFMNIK
ncbi:MAG: peptidoglycan DD-metalloendopeptidase family protein [Bacteroidota bacterium]